VAPLIGGMFMTGGSGCDRVLYRYTPAGGLVRRADAPVGLGCTNGNFAILCEDPKIAGRIHCWANNGAQIFFDDSSNTWRGVRAPGASLFAPTCNSSDLNFGIVGGTCPDYGVVCIAKWNRDSSRFYVYKP